MSKQSKKLESWKEKQVKNNKNSWTRRKRALKYLWVHYLVVFSSCWLKWNAILRRKIFCRAILARTNQSTSSDLRTKYKGSSWKSLLGLDRRKITKTKKDEEAFFKTFSNLTSKLKFNLKVEVIGYGKVLLPFY